MLAEAVLRPHAGSAGSGTLRADRRVWLAGSATAATIAVAAAAFYLPLPAGWAHALDGPLRLGAAAIVGLAVTGVQRWAARTGHAHAMHHAQLLLCVSGALMMVLTSDSLARAFGIAGAASLVRFRTPVDDARDAAVMFLLIGLGMACGLGAFTLAASGSVMICAFLVALARLGRPATRSLRLEVVAAGAVVPAGHVERVCARHGVALDVREVTCGDTARTSYLATIPEALPLETLNAELMAEGEGLRSLTWEPARKRLLG